MEFHIKKFQDRLSNLAWRKIAAEFNGTGKDVHLYARYKV
jgi:hypothetical protein